MPEPLVLVESRPDGVTLLRLNRPPLNPLSTALLRELEEIADGLSADPSVKAVVLTGSEKAFAAGADVSEFTADGAAAVVSDGIRAGLDALAAIPRPVIAAINGFALGGGFELALACDLRVAADSARLGFPEIQLGIFPGGGGTQRAARLIGPAKTKELIWSGRHVRAEEALAIGLVDRVVPAAEVLDTALEWAAMLGDGRGGRDGHRQARRRRGLDGPLSAGLDLETEGFVEVFGTDDAARRHPQLPRRRPRQGDVLGPLAEQVTDRRLRGRGLEVPDVGREDETRLHRPVGRRVPRLHERGVRRVERGQLRGVERRGGAEQEAEVAPALAEAGERSDRRVDVRGADPADGVAVGVERERRVAVHPQRGAPVAAASRRRPSAALPRRRRGGHRWLPPR